MYKLLFILTITFLAGCSKVEENLFPKNKNSTEVVIPIIFTIDPATGMRNNEELVNSFNEEYKGKYHIEVEWMLDGYRSRIKMLNVTDELPAVITDVRFLPDFYDLMVKDNRLMDLAPYILNDKEWIDAIEPQVLSACLEDGNKIYLSTLGTVSFSATGIFWNKKLFNKAGIKEFPKTWDEFFSCCNKLKNHNITPLSLHTDGTGWATMLLATARLGATSEGADFMRTELPKSFNNSQGKLLTETIVKLFKYTTNDSLNQDFDIAYNHFFNEETAMLPNGFWMIGQIDRKFKDAICFSPFPENITITSPEMSGWAIVDSYPQEVKDGALEFLKYRTLLGEKQKQGLLEDKNILNNAQSDYINVIKNDPKIIPNYQIQWNTIIQYDVIPKRIPELIEGVITQDGFIQYMDESVMYEK